jgi:hypothetical protein
MVAFEPPQIVRLTAALAALSVASAAAAEPAPAHDRGAAATPAGDLAKDEAPLPWHGTLFFWEHAVGTQTIGIGQDYQSSNPTYEMTFRLAPRYYFVENKAMSVSARADIRLLREFTNSDTTTERGEWTFLDTELWLAEVATLSGAKAHHSELIFRAPLLVLPTSKVSYDSGRTLGLGLGVGLDQKVPLRGEGADVLPSLMLRPRLTYTYQFASAIVATSDEIDRVRLDPDSRALPSDQLTGSALAQHQVNATLRVDTTITEQLGLVTEFGMRYARRYALPESVELCGVLATGCASVPSSSDRSRWGVQTLFAVSLGYSPLDYLEIGLTYGNLAPQLGEDGRRRNVFYSPYAQAALDFTVALDVLYQRATGKHSGESSHTAARRGNAPF